VRFIGYKYVEGRRVVVFVVILVLSSMLFSMMAFSLLGFYRVFGGYLGGGVARNWTECDAGERVLVLSVFEEEGFIFICFVYWVSCGYSGWYWFCG